MALSFTERKDNQTSNKLNTIAIPLAATPLCMVANIVLALSLGGGGNIPPNLTYITISSLDILSPLKVWDSWMQTWLLRRLRTACSLTVTLQFGNALPKYIECGKLVTMVTGVVIVHFSVCPTQLVAVFVQYRYLRHWLVFMSFLFTLSDVAYFVIARSFSP